jgi:hypothetical protein
MQPVILSAESDSRRESDSKSKDLCILPNSVKVGISTFPPGGNLRLSLRPVILSRRVRESDSKSKDPCILS